MTTWMATVHAGCVLLGETGLLIQGPPGSGKSTLARALVERWRARGEFAVIVADDRTRLRREGMRLVARPHPVIAGRMEVRGVGIIDEPGEVAAVVRALVEMTVGTVERMPEKRLLKKELNGLAFPILRLDSARSAAENAGIVEIWLNAAINS